MIKCPSCAATLPDWSQSCQFCHADTTKVARPAPVGKQSRAPMPSTVPPAWVWPAYYIVSALYILGGILPLVLGLAMTTSKEGSKLGFIGTVPIIVGSVSIVIGIGLIARIEFIRGITNIFSWLKIATATLSTFGCILLLLGGGMFAIPGLLGNLFDIVTAGFMIFLIGETDSYGY